MSVLSVSVANNIQNAVRRGTPQVCQWMTRRPGEAEVIGNVLELRGPRGPAGSPLLAPRRLIVAYAHHSQPLLLPTTRDAIPRIRDYMGPCLPEEDQESFEEVLGLIAECASDRAFEVEAVITSVGKPSLRAWASALSLADYQTVTANGGRP